MVETRADITPNSKQAQNYAATEYSRLLCSNRLFVYILQDKHVWIGLFKERLHLYTCKLLRNS